ncbi:MAG: dihydroorotase [Ruminococcaceae bacterium]|nr:dihydroorotase [Oscillospiraceae bacterium]
MEFALKNAHVYKNQKVAFVPEYTCEVKVQGGVAISSLLQDMLSSNVSEYGIFPGFCDVHVHLREPGFSYKETIKTGTMASARGGYTDVLSMPNLNPVPHSVDNMNIQRDIIKKDAVIGVHPFASLTVDEKGEKLSDMEDLAPISIGYSDDGRGVQSESLMRSAMEKAKALNKIISAHCEDNSLLNGGYIHKGEYAEKNNHRGICSESEWGPIKRDLKLAKETGCKYHVCHISTKESVELIRQAKKDGVDVTCETAPHYLVLNDMNLQEDGRFKMNPPIRSENDRLALIEGVLDGTIDMLATDHAPHSFEEKSKGLEKSLMGITGIETAFPIVYTKLIKTGVLPLELVIKMLTDNPRNRFGIKDDGSLTIWDLSNQYKIDSNEFLSLGKATPFQDESVFGKCLMTVYGGNVVWQAK